MGSPGVNLARSPLGLPWTALLSASLIEHLLVGCLGHFSLPHSLRGRSGAILPGSAL